MPLPRYAQNDVPFQQVSPVGSQAQAQMFSTLADRLRDFSGMAYQQGAEEATQRGHEQALKDVSSGSYKKMENGLNFYDKAYNTTAQAAFNAQTEMDLKSKAEEFSITAQNVDEFKSKFEGYAKGAVGKIDNPEYKAIYQATANKYATQFGNDLTKKFYERDRKNEVQSLKLFTTHLQEEYSRDYTDGKDVDFANNRWASSSLTKLNSNLDRRIELGDITPDEKGLILQETVEKANISKVVTDIKTENDLKRFASSKPDGWTEQQWSKAYTQAKKKIDILTAGDREAKAEAKANALVEANYMMDAMHTGNYTPSESDLRRVASTLPKSSARKLVDTYSNTKVLADFRSLSLDAQAETITRLSQKQKLIPREAILLDTLQDAHGKFTSMDTTTYGQQVLNLNMGTVTPSNPASISKRENAKQAVDAQRGVSGNILNKDELSMFKSAFYDPKTPDSKKVSMFNDLLKNSKNQNKLINELNSIDVSLGNIAELTIKNPRAAEEAMRGGLLRASMNPPKGIDIEVRAKIGNAFSGIGDTNYVKGIPTAVENVYLSKLEKKGKLGDDKIDSSILEESIKDVLGNTKRINSRDIVLPTGVTSNWFGGGKFDKWYDNLNEAHFQNVQGFTPKQLKDKYKNFNMVTLGDGVYGLENPNDNSIVKNKDGKILELRYK
jgi:predicted HAD superfamily Cof-like phosphohydrolase